jgi:glycosyltransferase involved in cell wall biosynthesis
MAGKLNASENRRSGTPATSNEITVTLSHGKFRVLYVATHPIQYLSTVLRKMASDPRLDLSVAYCSMDGVEGAIDSHFGVELKWDVPLLDGYPWVQVANRSPRPAGRRFFGLINSGLWKLVRAGNCDAVITQTGYNYLSYWILLAAAKTSGTPVIFVTDASSRRPFDVKKWKSFLKPLVVPRIFGLNEIIAPGSAAGYELFRGMGIPEDRIVLAPFVVDNGWWTREAAKVDRRAVRERWGIPESSPVILFCAKLQPWKRPFDLLRAFAAAAVPEAHLVFAGDGPQRAELQAETSSSGLSGRVHFLGFANQTQLPDIYGASDLMVLPSEYEPFGVVVNEAMLCGCPAAVSDRVGARTDLIAEGQTGYIFPCGDIKVLAAVLRTALADRPRLALMATAARQRMQTWSPQEHVERIVEGLTRVARIRKKNSNVES